MHHLICSSPTVHMAEAWTCYLFAGLGESISRVLLLTPKQSVTVQTVFLIQSKFQVSLYRNTFWSHEKHGRIERSDDLSGLCLALGSNTTFVIQKTRVFWPLSLYTAFRQEMDCVKIFYYTLLLPELDSFYVMTSVFLTYNYPLISYVNNIFTHIESPSVISID